MELKENKYMKLKSDPDLSGDDKKKKGKNTGAAIFFLILFLLALTGCGYLFLMYQKTSTELEDIKATITLTPEEAQVLVDNAVEENTLELKAEIKESLLGGDNSITLLRSMFPDDIVCIYENQYYFIPISDTLTKNTYLDENFLELDTGEVQYWSDNVKTSKKGVDVSKYQGEINWNLVRGDEVDFAFIRMGIRGYESGALVLDDTYVANMEGLAEAGIEAGVYFFTQSVSVEEAIEEADFVIENLAGYNVTYPVVLDVEDVNVDTARTNDLTVEERTAMVIAFCDRISEAGYTPMIYGNLKTFCIMLDMDQLENYQKWFAFYDIPVYFPYEYSYLQYTEKGIVNGIEGEVDLNIQMNAN